MLCVYDAKGTFTDFHQVDTAEVTDTDLVNVSKMPHFFKDGNNNVVFLNYDEDGVIVSFNVSKPPRTSS
jgi:hypothetical protein